MEKIKRTIRNINKPTNARVVKIFVITSLAVAFFPEWFNTIPFDVSDFSKDVVHWIFKGIDTLVACWALFAGVPYKSNNLYKK